MGGRLLGDGQQRARHLAGSLGRLPELSRPSADVLIWEQNGMAYRLEVNLLMSDTITIAESLQSATPVSP